MCHNVLCIIISSYYIYMTTYPHMYYVQYPILIFETNIYFKATVCTINRVHVYTCVVYMIIYLLNHIIDNYTIVLYDQGLLLQYTVVFKGTITFFYLVLVLLLKMLRLLTVCLTVSRLKQTLFDENTSCLHFFSFG